MGIIIGNIASGAGSNLWQYDGLNIINSNKETGGVNIEDNSGGGNRLQAYFRATEMLIELITTNLTNGTFRLDKDGAGVGIDAIRALMLETNGNEAGFEGIKDWAQLKVDQTATGGFKVEWRTTNDGVELISSSGGLVLKINRDGQILTNQLQAAVVYPTLVGTIELRDPSNALIGYLEVKGP
jgi:hypothetical protein